MTDNVLEPISTPQSSARGLRLLTRALPLVALVVACSQPGYSTNIIVPNGNFTNTANNGSVGGGLLTADGSSLVGSGPWSGTWDGLLGLLAPPLLTVSDSAGGGFARISGIAALNLAGIVDNGGFFSQTLTGTAYLPNTIYTLSADVDPDSLLSASVLAADGVGIALTGAGGATLASNIDGHLLTLSLLSGTDYRLVIQFITGAVAPTGDIGIRLFDTPTALASASLLTSVTFRDVTLDASPIGAGAVPEPGAFTQTGMGLTAVSLLILRFRKKKVTVQ